jgi:hypothetical protein
MLGAMLEYIAKRYEHGATTSSGAERVGRLLQHTTGARAFAEAFAVWKKEITPGVE